MWQLVKTGLLGFFALSFIGVGITHFTNEAFFLKIMPPYIPAHQICVWLSGLVEILGGLLLLVPATRRWGAWLLIGLLIAVFPANIHVYQNQHLVPASPAAHLLRLPLQGVMIAWAWFYTRTSSGSPEPASSGPGSGA